MDVLWLAYFTLGAVALGAQCARADEPRDRSAQAEFTGFAIGSGENELSLHGLVQVDGRRFLDENTAGDDEWLFRRVRPTIEGTFGGIYDLRITGEFADGKALLNNASLAVSLDCWAKITVGKFKMPVSLLRAASSGDTRFIEHALPASLVPNLGIGVQLSGESRDKTIAYAIGFFNAAPDGAGALAVNKALLNARDVTGDVAARIFFRPFADDRDSIVRGLGFGVAGTYADLPGTGPTATLPSYRTPGQRAFFRYRSSKAETDSPPVFGAVAYGERWRVCPQAYYFAGSFGAAAEYVLLSQEVTRATPNSGRRSDSLEHTAWQLQVAWLVTGEEQSIREVVPNAGFSPGNRTLGASELVARVHSLDVDEGAFTGGDDSFSDPGSAPRAARSWGVGFNWYPNQYYKWSLDYEVTHFKGGGPDGARRPHEEALFTRFTLQF